MINALFDNMRQSENVTVVWETKAEKLLTEDDGAVCGVKVRKSDGCTAKVHWQESHVGLWWFRRQS